MVGAIQNGIFGRILLVLVRDESAQLLFWHSSAPISLFPGSRCCEKKKCEKGSFSFFGKRREKTVSGHKSSYRKEEERSKKWRRMERALKRGEAFDNILKAL